MWGKNIAVTLFYHKGEKLPLITPRKQLLRWLTLPYSEKSDCQGDFIILVAEKSDHQGYFVILTTDNSDHQGYFAIVVAEKSDRQGDLLCHAHDGESHPAFLTSRQTGHRSNSKVSADSKTAQLCSVHLCCFPWNNNDRITCTCLQLNSYWCWYSMTQLQDMKDLNNSHSLGMPDYLYPYRHCR